MIKKIICLFFTLIIGVENCYAVNANFINRLVESNGGSNTGDTEIPYIEWKEDRNGRRKYQYRYKKEINTSTTISINAYDLEGNSVIPNSIKLPEGKTFKAGTWVGINVTENRDATWKVYDFQYQEVKKTYTCKYTRPGGTYSCNQPTVAWAVSQWTCQEIYKGTYIQEGPGKCEYTIQKTCYRNDQTKEYSIESSYYGQPNCPLNHPTDSRFINPVATETGTKEYLFDYIPANLKQQAIDEVHEAAENSVSQSSSVVKYITNNTFPDNKEGLEYRTLDEGESPNFEINEEYGDGTSGYVARSYEILENKVCMNLKTSKVSYGRECNTSKGEIQLENGTVTDKFWLDKNNKPRSVNYWHYFIPLNAKSDSLFTLDVVKNENAKFSIAHCESFMKSFSEKKEEEDGEGIDGYVNYIVPYNSNKVFIGDYNKKTDKNNTLDLKILEEAGGCNISTKIVFPISQEFYHEKTEGKNNKNVKLKGFNFYYKPVDIDNPFPNGIATNSLWKEWEKSTNKKPNISKSYNKITYIAENINAKKVRKYNDNHPYTSWKNMNINGSSKFIDNQNIIKRNSNVGKIYGLGCGPANKKKYLDTAKKVKNFLYQEECAQ